MPNLTRKQRVNQMLRRPKGRLTRQLGKRNLLNTRRNSNLSHYTGFTNNNNNSLVSSLYNSTQNYFNEQTILARPPGLSNQEQRNINMVLQNLQRKHNEEEAYRQRKTLTGYYNRFRQQQRNKQSAKESAAMKRLYNRL